jgi:hypothetical protein
MEKINTHFKRLLRDHWGFMEEEWPTIDVPNNHRTAVKNVELIKLVKETLMRKLGALPVFFFLVVVWSQAIYPGPYREVEKGLLILYHLAIGTAMDGMSPHIPKSSFHAIHSDFYKTHRKTHSKQISHLLGTMFSTFHLRVLSAKLANPPLFQHVTLHLDGHDTRLSCEEKSSTEMYSYKLKKAGVRTQVCVDCNGMAILVSKSMPCKDNNDGTMLLGMKIHKYIHPLDCIAVDGGYPQYIKKLVEDNELTNKNFCYPIRKHRGKELAKYETNYNKIFGSFRSQMEAIFGELGTVFEKHNNRRPVLVTKIETYNLQLQLSLLLMNVKKMVALFGIEVEPIHQAWMRDGFDYPSKNGAMEQNLAYIPVAKMLEDAESLTKLQEEFVAMSMEVDEEEEQGLPTIPKRKSLKRAG